MSARNTFNETIPTCHPRRINKETRQDILALCFSHPTLTSLIHQVLKMKRKKPDTLAPGKQTISESTKSTIDQTPTHPQPTTFLTLPRELRQKILYLSCSFELAISNRQPPNRKRHRDVTKRVGDLEVHHYTLWAQLLKVAVRDIAFWHDLDYVM